MPDPKVALPVRVEADGDVFAIVDADGKKIEGGGGYADKAKATSDAGTINSAWKKAKSDRKAKGAPPITKLGEALAALSETWSDEARAAAALARARHGHGSPVPLHRLKPGDSFREDPDGPVFDHDGPGSTHGTISGRDEDGQALEFLHDTHVFPVKKKKLAEALAELDESSLLAAPLTHLPHRQGGMRIHIDPRDRVYARNRLGEFAPVVGRLHQTGGHITMPHGVTIRSRLGKHLEVEAPGEKTRLFTTPEVATAHALHIVDKHEPHDIDHLAKMHELVTARTAALHSHDFADQSHAEELMRQTRIAHGERRAEQEVAKGRTSDAYTEAELAAYRARFPHGTPGEREQHTREMFSDPHQRIRQLPPRAVLADRAKPSMEGDVVRTGYGRYEIKPAPGTTGIFDLHRDGQRVGMVGTKAEGHVVLSVLHDEAMMRHVEETRPRLHAALGALTQKRASPGDRVQHREDGSQAVVTGAEVNGRTPVKFKDGSRDPDHVFYVKTEDLESLERPKSESGPHVGRVVHVDGRQVKLNSYQDVKLGDGSTGRYHGTDETGAPVIVSAKRVELMQGAGGLGYKGTFEHPRDELGTTHFTVKGYGKLDDGTGYIDTEGLDAAGLHGYEPPIPRRAWPKPSSWLLLDTGEVMDGSSGDIVAKHDLGHVAKAVAGAKVHKGNYYFPTFADARVLRDLHPGSSIVRYGRGHAVQQKKSGPYLGPSGWS